MMVTIMARAYVNGPMVLSMKGPLRMIRSTAEARLLTTMAQKKLGYGTTIFSKVKAHRNNNMHNNILINETDNSHFLTNNKSILL